MTFRNWWRNNIHAPDPWPTLSRLDLLDTRHLTKGAH